MRFSHPECIWKTDCNISNFLLIIKKFCRLFWFSFKKMKGGCSRLSILFFGSPAFHSFLAVSRFTAQYPATIEKDRNCMHPKKRRDFFAAAIFYLKKNKNGEKIGELSYKDDYYPQKNQKYRKYCYVCCEYSKPPNLKMVAVKLMFVI